MIYVALKNLLLNYRRSLVVLISIAISATGLLLGFGYMNASLAGLSENYISENGHIQIFNQNYFAGKDLLEAHHRIEDYKTVISEIAKLPGVDIVTPRVSFTGLVGTEARSVMMIGQGLIPENEKHVGTGGFFAPIVTGRYFSSQEVFKACLGYGLRKNLDLEEGDFVNLLVNTPSGSYNTLSVQVACGMRFGITEHNDAKVELNLAAALKLLHIDQVDRLVILLQPGEGLELAKQRLSNFLQANFSGLIIKDWVEVSPYYTAVKNLFLRIFSFMVILMGSIMVLSIFNAISSSVLERTREIGVMRAIGGKRSQIAFLFFAEMAILSLLGFFIACGFYQLTSEIVHQMGVMMPPAPGRTYSYPLSFSLKPIHYVYIFALVLVSGIFGSLVPVLKIMRLKVTEALTHV